MSYDAEQGWCRLPGLLDRSQIASVQACCDRLLALASHERCAGDKPHAGTRHLVQLEERCAAVAAALDDHALSSAVATLVDGKSTTLRASYRSPQPGFGAQKLHADGLARLAPAPESVATAIVALVDFTTDNGATRLIPGSHLRPDLQRQAGQLERHHDEIVLTGSAGTAFLFSGHVLHSGTKNKSQNERPALQLIWEVTP